MNTFIQTFCRLAVLAHALQQENCGLGAVKTSLARRVRLFERKCDVLTKRVSELEKERCELADVTEIAEFTLIGKRQ